ncbi:class I SAM-dependent methyltransferase [bacterium]|nr:class I SAM-dependent methyltransferase [bacterium]
MGNYQCIICGGETSPYSSSPGYFICGCCGVVFLERSRVVSPEEEKERYLKHTNGTDEPGYTGMLDEFIKVCVAPFAGEGSFILDYGSGPEPLLARFLEGRGYKTDTYDPFFAPEKKFEFEKYGAVTAVEVLEHMKDPLGEIKIIADILKPGGIFAGRTMFLPQEEKKFANWWYRFDITHITFYSPQSLAHIAEAAGMELILGEAPCFFVMVKK